LKIKRFFAKDIRSALDEIKIALGPDAIIMSNKKVDGGVEIVAAIDDDNIATIPKSSVAKETPVVKRPAVNPVSKPKNTPEIGIGNSHAREIGDDQVSLSGFQQRLVKQQIQVQAEQLLAKEPVREQAITSNRFQPASAPVDRRLADSHSQLPDWAKTGTMTPQSAGFASGANAYQNNATKASHAGFGSPTPSAPGVASHQDNNQAIDQLRQEMASMRQLLQHQVNGLVNQDVARRDPTRSVLSTQLVDAGFDYDIAQQLVIDIPPNSTMENAKRAIANSIFKRLVTTNNDVIEQGGIVALLGPTGVGKTTTIAKLAARYAMAFGSDQVALITTDSYRIGAFEQLNTYGKILGCPVKVAKDAQQLADALYQLRNKRLVLIDTAGMGQRDVRLSEQLSTLVNTSHVNIRSYLVLPATAQRKVLQEAIEQFRKIPITGCIMTKMDEALGAAEVISVAIANSLPIGYVTNGQRVPEDIGVVDINALVNGVIEQLGNDDKHQGVSSSPAQFISFNR
jgi:flagellar biosynthesis protein FlhF